MPRVDLTARLARQTKAAKKDTILFDKALPGFGLRIHPSGRKVWIVQARIQGRSRRIVIAGYTEMRLAEARRRARDLLGACAVGRFSSGRMIRGRGNFVLTTAVPDIGTGNRHPALQGGVNRSPAGSMTVPDRRHRTAIPVIRPPEALASA